MRSTLLITKIFFFVLLIFAMVVMSNKAPQCFNRLSHYFKDTRPYTPQKNHSRYGGTLVWGTVNPPTIINPVLTSHSVSAAVLRLVFDSLIRIDSKGSIEPGLAYAWDISSDGLKYTFHLHKGVRFHDGVELTARDVIFTYQAIADKRNNSYRHTDTLSTDHWEEIAPYTVRLVLKKPFVLILLKLECEILPKHLYEHTDLLKNPHNYSPVGTGPFRFQSWDHLTNEIVLAANNGYFEGRPFLDRIVIKVYKDNVSLWTALMRGDVDFVKFLNQKDYEVLSKDPAFKTYQFPTGFYFAIVYDLHDPVLNNREFRHAINYAVDRKALMRAVGIDGVESNGPFYYQSSWINKEIEPVSYDPLRAIKTLNQLGWRDMDEAGILKKKNKPLVLTMLVDHNSWYYCQMALVLRQQLSEVGVGLKIEFYDNENQLTKDYLAHTKAQMWLRMFMGRSYNPLDIVYSWYSSTSEFGRIWNYKDKKVDQLFEQGLSIRDEKQRIKVYQKIYSLVYEDQPACFLFFPVIYSVVSSKVSNTAEFFNDNMPDYLIKQWFIANGRR